MNPQINQLSHKDLLTVLDQMEKNAIQPDGSITFKGRATKPEVLHAALVSRLDNTPDKRLKERIFRAIASDFNALSATGEKSQPVPASAIESEMPLQTLQSSARQRMGGKGQFLDLMHQAGIPVPPFYAVETHLLQAIEALPIKPGLLKEYLPVDVGEGLSLTELKRIIAGYDAVNQAK